MPDEPQILIVGAGPVGLSLAAALHTQGIRPRVIDRKSGPSTHSKALAMHSRTVELMERLGVHQRLLEMGRKLGRAKIHADGKLIASPQIDKLDAPYPFVLAIDQSMTERVLIDHLESVGVPVEWECELTKLASKQDNVHASLLRNGEIEDTTFTYVCACDGAHSTCRHQLNLDFPGEPYPQEFLLADVEMDWSRPPDELQAYLGPRGIAAFVPLPGKRRYRIITDYVDEKPRKGERNLPSHAHREPPTPEELQRIVRRKCPVGITLKGCEWSSYFKIHRRAIVHLRHGPVFFLGDAAHIHSPVGGQGMNTGMQEAFNLAWKVAFSLKGIAQPALLDSFETERGPICRSTLRGTDLASRMVFSRNIFVRVFRKHIVPLASSSERMQRRLRQRLSMLSVNYRDCVSVEDLDEGEEAPVVLGVRAVGDKPRAGDRLPRGGDEASQRLYRRLSRDKLTLLVFSDSKDEGESKKRLQSAGEIRSRFRSVVDLVAVTPDPNSSEMLADPDNVLRQHFMIPSSALFLIRPDDHIGFASRPADPRALERYLERFYLANTNPQEYPA